MSFARWLIRVSDIVFGVTGVLGLMVPAVNGYWTLFFPFLAVVASHAWWLATPARFTLGPVNTLRADNG